MILTPFFQLQLFNSFELPRFPPLFFLFHRKCVLSSFCVHTRVSVYVCHLLPDECFNSGFGCSFPFFFLFYFLKIIFPFKNKFTRKSAPLPLRRTGRSHLFKNRTDFPSLPEQELLRWPPEAGVSPCLADALVAVKAPLPQWRFLIVGHSLVFVFFLSSN